MEDIKALIETFTPIINHAIKTEALTAAILEHYTRHLESIDPGSGLNAKKEIEQLAHEVEVEVRKKIAFEIKPV